MTDATEAATNPAPDEFDEWLGESGFKDDFDGLVTEAFFTKDSRYNNGETLVLILKILADDGEELEQMYPCGTDWDSYDNGETAEHPKDREGKPKGFNQNTAVFGLMSHAFEAGAENVMRERGRPRKAGIWNGLKFHWKVESRDITIRDRKTGENRTITTTRTFPEKFIGVFDVGGGGSQTESTSTAPVSQASGRIAAASSNGSGFNLDAIDPAQLAKLKVHAKTKPYNEFLDLALAIDGVTTNDDLLAMLGEQSFYDQLKA